ncbi:hypothetical protein GMORB2_3566 [Geosmithia morbida]|uniref:Uncharacterized protein n=1 Tax=Geosmithia morbida TaxID=1094350 RepID=A0A9P4YQJ2_9HYPO|nr:uncharacterized protein GMORB2_3566 [Geosmithia morbida]KAF4119878.1 hypothetical protein GMORB2_3566 [Geosmithia morbida]
MPLAPLMVLGMALLLSLLLAGPLVLPLSLLNMPTIMAFTRARIPSAPGVSKVTAGSRAQRYFLPRASDPLDWSYRDARGFWNPGPPGLGPQNSKPKTANLTRFRTYSASASLTPAPVLETVPEVESEVESKDEYQPTPDSAAMSGSASESYYEPKSEPFPSTFESGVPPDPGSGTSSNSLEPATATTDTRSSTRTRTRTCLALATT